MKYLAAFFALVFLLFAYWQINDPDPVWWITIYLVMVYASVQVFRGKYNFEMFTVLSVLYIAGAVNSWLLIKHFQGLFTEGQGLNMKTPDQELARESSGLGICFAVMAIYAIAAFIRKRSVEKILT